MKGSWVFILLIAFIFQSCTEEKKKARLKKSAIHQPFLINMQHYFSENEKNVSFPVWFNDSVIKKQAIKSITRKIYLNYKNEDSQDEVLKEYYKYNFNKDGELLSFEIFNYYEGIQVGHTIFNYLGEKDEWGFAPVERLNDNPNPDEEQTTYPIYNKGEYADRYLVYNNVETGNYLFYLLLEENWRPLTVDSIFQPTPDDRIIFGSPFRPVKKYYVQNIVNEFDLINLKYKKNSDYLLRTEFENYPFNYSRTIHYNKKGFCSGYIDSTFSATKFLTRRIARFKLNNENLPVLLTHKTQAEGNRAVDKQTEVFEYEFYETQP